MSQRRSREDIIRLIRASMPWDQVASDLMDPANRAVYERRKEALHKYLDGEPLSLIKTSTAVGGNALRKMIDRCLIVAPDGRLFGYRALIPNRSIKEYERKKDFEYSVASNGAGFAGVLKNTFRRYPGLQDALDSYILKKGSSKGKLDADRYCNRVKDVHQEFIQLLKRRNHPSNQWPFTHKFRGQRTISGYVTALQAENVESTVRLHGDKAALAHMSVGRGEAPGIKNFGVNEVWEIDTHRTDTAFVLGLLNNAGIYTYVELASLHILAIINARTDAVIWFRIIYGADTKATDVVALIREALSHKLPEPVKTIPGLEPIKGAGFPAQLFEELRGAPPAIIKLDNALAHLANVISCALKQQIGSVLCFGPPGEFSCRPNIENYFKEFTQELGQRMRSSKGTGPDGGGDKNPGQAAVKYKIESRYLEHLVYVTLANHNAMENSGLGYETPISATAQLISYNNHHIPKKIPADRLDSVGKGLVKIRRTVNGNLEDNIPPYVNFESSRYTSKQFQQATNLIGEEIILSVDESNIVVVDAYLLNGEPLGALTVQGCWAKDPHSRALKKQINALRYRKVITWTENMSPVRVFNEHLEREILAAEASGKKAKKQASDLDKLRHDAAEIEKNGVVAPSEDIPVGIPAAPASEQRTPCDYVLPSQETDLLALIKKMK